MMFKLILTSIIHYHQGISLVFSIVYIQVILLESKIMMLHFINKSINTLSSTCMDMKYQISMPRPRKRRKLLHKTFVFIQNVI